MALLYKIDNSIFIEDLNSNQFDIALNGAFFKFDNQSQVYTIFNQFTGVTVKIKVSEITSYRNELAVSYTESTLLAFLRLNTGASASGGSSSLTLYGLSTNDYTNAEKSKLAGIQANAEVNVQADWNETNPSSDAFILNKPAIIGGVNSFNTRTGAVTSQNGDYTADQITETGTKVFVTPSEKTAITHSNRSVLDLITEAFTTALKTAYDSTVTWISTNGANVLSHLSSTSNPHNVTKSQVGLGNVDNTSDLDKPTSTVTQTQIDATNTAFNDFVTVDYVNDLNAKQDTLVSGTNIKTVEGVSLLGSGNLRLLDETRVFLFNDFLSATALQPFVGGAISTGTIAQNTTNFSANTLGVCRITKSTTANSGYRAVTDSNSLRLKGGEVYTVRFCPLNVTTQTFRGGFIDATTVTESVDGVYFQIANSGDLVLKTSNNSVRTTSSVLATLVVNTWYKIEVVIGAGATSAYMNLYDATGTLIGSTTPITTNIPTGVGRETGCGFVSTGSSTTADALLDIDFHYFEQTLTR